MKGTSEINDDMLDSYMKLWLETRDARYLPAAVEARIDEGNKEEALSLCMEGIQLGEMSSTLGVLAGGLLISMGREEEAAKILRDVLLQDPMNFEASRLLRGVRTERIDSFSDFVNPSWTGGAAAAGGSEEAEVSFSASVGIGPEENPVVRRIRDIVESID